MANSLRERAGELSLEAGARVLQALEGMITRSSLVDTTPFLSPAEFPWVARLEAGWKEIRRELDDVLAYQEDLPNFQDISADQATITDDDRWKTFFLYGFGFKSDANCARCPETTRLIESVPGMKTAFFSILAPHKRIPPHRGPWKGVLRYHLALMVPQPTSACGIRVGDEVAHWEDGRSLLFDDSYEHEAWNETEGTRVVLFMDVVRPLRFPASAVNKAVIKAVAVSPFVTDAKRAHEEWERRFDQKQQRRVGLGPHRGEEGGPAGCPPGPEAGQQG